MSIVAEKPSSFNFSDRSEMNPRPKPINRFTTYTIYKRYNTEITYFNLAAKTSKFQLKDDFYQTFVSNFFGINLVTGFLYDTNRFTSQAL